jgi:hypothetical protein
MSHIQLFPENDTMSIQMPVKEKLCPVTITCTFLKCRRPFTPTNKRQRFCTAKCRAAAHYLPKKIAAQQRKDAAQPQKNDLFRARNRDRALGFDSRYTGPDCPAYRGTPKELPRLGKAV